MVLQKIPPSPAAELYPAEGWRCQRRNASRRGAGLHFSAVGPEARN